MILCLFEATEREEDAMWREGVDWRPDLAGMEESIEIFEGAIAKLEFDVRLEIGVQGEDPRRKCSSSLPKGMSGGRVVAHVCLGRLLR